MDHALVRFVIYSYVIEMRDGRGIVTTLFKWCFTLGVDKCQVVVYIEEDFHT